MGHTGFQHHVKHYGDRRGLSSCLKIQSSSLCILYFLYFVAVYAIFGSEICLDKEEHWDTHFFNENIGHRFLRSISFLSEKTEFCNLNYLMNGIENLSNGLHVSFLSRKSVWVRGVPPSGRAHTAVQRSTVQSFSVRPRFVPATLRTPTYIDAEVSR